ncbi:MAG: hypothetical protein IAE87_17545 [Rhodobacteraceae bacterium]|nr:hypothetical protein [Paracoccaceae bacterium]
MSALAAAAGPIELRHNFGQRHLIMPYHCAEGPAEDDGRHAPNVCDCARPAFDLVSISTICFRIFCEGNGFCGGIAVDATGGAAMLFIPGTRLAERVTGHDLLGNTLQGFYTNFSCGFR